MVYRNRYGDYITFTDGPEVTMTGDYEYLRTGGDEENISFVDPAGGPMVAVGTDLNKFFRDGKERIVESISINNGIVTFKTNNDE